MSQAFPANCSHHIIMRIRTWRTRLHTAPATRNGLMCLPFFRERMRTQGRASAYISLYDILQYVLRVSQPIVYSTMHMLYTGRLVNNDAMQSQTFDALQKLPFLVLSYYITYSIYVIYNS